MGFMQKQIYQDFYYEVETSYGTEIIPSDLVGTVNIKGEDCIDYCEGEVLDLYEPLDLKHGYLARMSAPGYMDCTSWSAHSTYEEANKYLDDMYGEDDEENE